MPPKGNSGIWHDAPFLEDLALVMYEAAHHAGGLTPRVKNAVEETLRKLGHEVSWEAIRYVGLCACIFDTLGSKIPWLCKRCLSRLVERGLDKCRTRASSFTTVQRPASKARSS